MMAGEAVTASSGDGATGHRLATPPEAIIGPRGATGISLSEAEAARVFDNLPAVRLRESGVHQVAITGEVTLTTHRGPAALAFVRFLREATSAGVWVSWSGLVAPDLDPGALSHLPPPLADSRPGQRTAGPAWRSSHEAGLCYYRVGPGFVQITDRRPGAAPHQAVLSSRPQLDVFTSYLVPGPVPESGEARSESGEARHAVYRALIRDRFLLRIGDQAVTLPHRLLCRPVPWNVF